MEITFNACQVPLKLLGWIPCTFSLSFFLLLVSRQQYMPLVLMPLKIINGDLVRCGSFKSCC